MSKLKELLKIEIMELTHKCIRCKQPFTVKKPTKKKSAIPRLCQACAGDVKRKWK